MTFDSAAWAINGPLLSASLARRALYANSRTSGIVQKDDLKVTQLGTPGVGVLIAAGVGLVLNKYQTTPNETYVTNNPGTHTIPSGQMPPSNPSAKSWIVAIVIGDPDFSQAGHPWMLATDPPDGTVDTFAYVRPTLIEVSAGATTIPGAAYPHLVLARIDIPANTTTITNAMITDLRKLANPRQEQQIFVGNPWTNASPQYIPSGTAFADWGAGQFAPNVTIPVWAKRAVLVASINGVVLVDSSVNISGSIRTQLGSVVGPSTVFDLPVGRVGTQRDNFQTAGTYDVSAIAGTTVAIRLEGFENVPASPTTNQRLSLRGGSQMIFDVRFFEE